MKVLTIIIGFLLTQQILRAQNMLTSGKQVVVRYQGAGSAEELGNDSIGKTKFYNLHIVKNFPNLQSDVKRLTAMDDAAPAAPDEIYGAPAPASYDKGPLKNIKWTAVKTRKH